MIFLLSRCIIVVAALFSSLLALSFASPANTVKSSTEPIQNFTEDGVAVSFSTNTTSNSLSGESSRLGIIPRWIETTGKRRATKLLEEPLETQLEFHDQSNTVKNEDGQDENRKVSSESRVLPLTFPGQILIHPAANIKMSSSIGHVPIVRVAGVQKQDRVGSGNNSSPGSEQKKRLNAKEPAKKQDIDLVAQPIEFSSVVSPIEASLGGFTGFQDLPPLSFIQMSKLLVAITPFILPMIFIPLLIFTIGILMIPVSRNNVFFDFGELRGGPLHTPSNSFLSNYLFSPMKKYTGNVVMPRAYSIANDLINHEECIERISCDISARYLQYDSWDGSWPSILNRSWISRVMNYFWGNDSTVSRIAKSLEVEQNQFPVYSDEVENSRNSTASGSTNTLNKSEEQVADSERSSIRNSCKRYVCQPRTFLRKFWNKK